MALQVGIVRDDRYLEHKTGLVHPEHPNRLAALYNMLDQDFPAEFMLIKPEPAAMDQLELVHTPTYIKKVLRTADRRFTYLAPDTPAGPKSYLAAWLAVGGCLKALDLLMRGGARAAFALVRPPGHHALPDRATGFCIFNNLAVTARRALMAYGLRRVLIVDWDIHHGNGIQEVFYEESEVLYFSSHYLGTYPATGEWGETGRGAGTGYTVNLPLPKEMTDGEILHCYREILGPVFRRWRPELVLVAAGFDAHRQDPMSRTSLTERAFGFLTRLIMDLGAGNGGPPILLALEGGYDIKSLTASVREVLCALTGRDDADGHPDLDPGRGPDLVETARRVHAAYGIWT
ncbi:MAG: histone deacetylase [Thermodesulfobacteriota bacterium]